jgi:four helix bundle protein
VPEVHYTPYTARVRAAESRNDFIHKLGVVRKELCECLEWLRLIARKHLVPAETLEPIRDECEQLVRIVSASKITAEKNARLGKKKEEAEEEREP